VPNTPGSEVVVVGNVGIDTSVFLPSSPELIDGLREEGHFSSNVDCLGHAGGYTARGFAALGLDTAFIGHVGDDQMGRWVRAELTGDGIDLTGLGIDPQGTARSVNLMGSDGSRINFYDGRGHRSIAADPALAEKIFAGSRLAMFHLPDWARTLLPVAKRAGAVLACDLQDVRDPDDDYLTDFIEGADILFVSSTHHLNPAPMLKQLVRRSNGSMVVCGRGGLGVAIATTEGIRVYPPPRVDLPIVDTNGAGDALAVGFLVAHELEGRPVEEAVQRGQLAARWTCAQRASSSDLVTREQLEELVVEASGALQPA
jgi:sugar/nucleoside kinase (ribokinase family)